MVEVEGPTAFRTTRALLSSMLLNLIIGSYYVYGNINLAVSGYIGVSDSTGTLIAPIWLFTQSITTAFSVRLAESIGYRTTNFIGFFVIIMANVLSSFVSTPYLFIPLYSLGNGIGCGLSYLMGMYICWTYFPKRKSIATGAVLFMSGLSAYFLISNHKLYS